ncbi:MAG: recombinase family protein [Oscillospiraceae bacterium]|nr:recombinase family protein [Oscillospiraceae bacterium]
MDIKNVVLLCRSETHEQLIIQRNHLLKIAEENNWQVVAVIMEKHKGRYRRRFRLRLAMNLAQRHRAAILVGDVSRLSRNPSIAIEYAKQLRHRNIKLISAKDDVKTDQVNSILQYEMLAKLASMV